MCDLCLFNYVFVFQTIYFTSKHEYFRSHRLNESVIFPSLRLSLQSSPQSLSVSTINQQKNPMSLEKATRNVRRRPQWTPQDDEQILLQLHLSHILISPFLSSKNSFPQEVETSCLSEDKTETANWKRTTGKMLHQQQRAYEGGSKSVSHIFHLLYLQTIILFLHIPNFLFCFCVIYFRHQLRRKTHERQQRCYNVQ